LLVARATDLNSDSKAQRPKGRGSKSYIDRVGSWLKQGF